MNPVLPVKSQQPLSIHHIARVYPVNTRIIDGRTIHNLELRMREINIYFGTRSVVEVAGAEWIIIRKELDSDTGLTFAVENITEVKDLPKWGDQMIYLGKAESWNKTKLLN